MNDLILGIAVLIGGAAAHDDGYIDVGLAMHSNAYDGPEVRLSNPLGTVEAGIQSGRYKVYFEHISGLSTVEEGAGLNMIGIKVRIK